MVKYIPVGTGRTKPQAEALQVGRFVAFHVVLAAQESFASGFGSSVVLLWTTASWASPPFPVPFIFLAPYQQQLVTAFGSHTLIA